MHGSLYFYCLKISNAINNFENESIPSNYIDDYINCTFIYQGIEAILVGYKWFVSCKLKLFLHRFCRRFSHPPTAFGYFWTFCKDKCVYFIILSEKTLRGQAWFFKYRTCLFYSCLSFCHSVFLTFCIYVWFTLLLTFIHWVLEIWNFTWIFLVIPVRSFCRYITFWPWQLTNY